MVRSDTDVSNSNKFLVATHTEVTEIRGEPKKHERNWNPIAIAVDDRRFAVSIGFPITALKVDT